jgi:hypothetical protein
VVGCRVVEWHDRNTVHQHQWHAGVHGWIRTRLRQSSSRPASQMEFSPRHSASLRMLRKKRFQSAEASRRSLSWQSAGPASAIYTRTVDAMVRRSAMQLPSRPASSRNGIPPLIPTGAITLFAGWSRTWRAMTGECWREHFQMVRPAERSCR